LGADRLVDDTTRNSMSGGLMALAENPEQFELVHSRRELVPNLVSEALASTTMSTPQELDGDMAERNRAAEFPL
jgi:hypothetical protein